VNAPCWMEKDYVGAILLSAVGAGVIVLGVDYRVGSFRAMGPGFFPLVLGCLLVLIGGALAGVTLRRRRAGGNTPALPDEATRSRKVAWRGWLCIIGAILAFVILGRFGGLIPATFASVFISALGDRQNTVRQAALLAVCLVVAGALIFGVGLHVSLPLFNWGG
jgi:hypothetical protein